MIAEQRLNQAELAARLERSYPWDDDTLKAAWQAELETLAAAAFAESDAEAVELARQFLDLRGQRRAEGRLTAALIDYEQQREWLEGLAKYAELTLLRAAIAKDREITQVQLDPRSRRMPERSRR
jgi:hypothetical protein